MCRPGLAWKPRLWPGFQRLWLSESTGRAKAVIDGSALAWLGLSRGLGAKITIKISAHRRSCLRLNYSECTRYKATVKSGTARHVCEAIWTNIIHCLPTGNEVRRTLMSAVSRCWVLRATGGTINFNGSNKSFTYRKWVLKPLTSAVSRCWTLGAAEGQKGIKRKIKTSMVIHVISIDFNQSN